MNFIHIFWFLFYISASVSWSSTINGIIKPKAILPIAGRLNPLIIESIAAGAQMAMDECKNIFKWDRWNCPQSSFSRQYKPSITRERAYTEAIVAAGVVYTISKNCSNGELEQCGCNQKHPNAAAIKINKTADNTDWAWNGCSDDTKYAEEVVLNHLESYQKNEDLQAFVNRHNNAIGRKIVRETMERRCRCHGISGSCSLQTCWMQLAAFSKIAQKLRDRYQKALLISYNQMRGALHLGNSVRQESLEELSSKFPNNLFYLEQSPNYCVKNNRTGWSGTKGRICSKTFSQTTSSFEKRSCKHLCRSCGFRVRKEKKQVTSRCNCKFVWCCEVTCDVCVDNVEEYFCE